MVYYVINFRLMWIAVMAEPFTILLVEDDPDTTLLIRHALKAAGLHLYTATSAVEGMALIDDVRPDLVIMDLLLPGSHLKGIDAIRLIKQTPALCQIPVIAISAGGYEMMEKALAAGSDDCLSKPFTMRDLRQKIGQYTGSAV